MGKRVLVVGGVAGGASAAARVRRLDAEASITVFERGEHVSFSNCSLPYFLSRTVGDAESLVLMTPEGFKASYDIDVRTSNEVCAIDRAAKKVRVRNELTGEEYEEAYDASLKVTTLMPDSDHDLDWYGVGYHNNRLLNQLKSKVGGE